MPYIHFFLSFRYNIKFELSFSASVFAVHTLVSLKPSGVLCLINHLADWTHNFLSGKQSSITTTMKESFVNRAKKWSKKQSLNLYETSHSFPHMQQAVTHVKMKKRGRESRMKTAKRVLGKEKQVREDTWSNSQKIINLYFQFYPHSLI